jgi:predicted nucleic acid-binding protein
MISALINVDSIKCNKTLLDKSLSTWQRHNVSFIDAYLAAIAELENLTLYSYDQKFDQIKTAVRKEP